MKYFKTIGGKVWAYEEDGSQDHLIATAPERGLAPMGEAEILNHRFPPPDPALLHIQELRTLEAQITPLMLAEALLSGDTAPLRAAVQKIKDAKGKIK